MSKSSKERRKKMREQRRLEALSNTLKDASYPYKAYKSCHEMTEIYRNLWIGSIKDQFKLAMECNVLIPLDSIDGEIWDYGFNGEIHYWPITDFSVLPMRVLIKAVDDILNCLKQGKKVGIFCIGGHGRTGYITACVLGKLGIQDPIKYLRENYCEKAIESNSQVKQIAQFLHNDKLLDYVETDVFNDFYGGDWGGGYYGSNFWSSYYKNGYSCFGKVERKEDDTEIEEEVDLTQDSSEDFSRVNQFLLEGNS